MNAAQQSGDAKGVVRIRKYPNRRLYNTSSRSYVNLEDLAALIRQGREVQVLDAKTGEDLTRLVLTQIIMEDAREAPTGLPLELLRHLIVASDRAGREFIMWYLKSAFEAYGKVQGAVESRLKDVGSAALAPIHMVKDLFTPSESKAGQEVELLRRRVAELEQLLERRKKRR